MHSDTETEEEVLYDTQKKQEKNKLMAPNNMIRNNISPPGRRSNNSNGIAWSRDRNGILMYYIRILSHG